MRRSAPPPPHRWRAPLSFEPRPLPGRLPAWAGCRHPHRSRSRSAAQPGIPSAFHAFARVPAARRGGSRRSRMARAAAPEGVPPALWLRACGLPGCPAARCLHQLRHPACCGRSPPNAVALSVIAVVDPLFTVLVAIPLALAVGRTPARTRAPGCRPGAGRHRDRRRAASATLPATLRNSRLRVATNRSGSW